MVKEKKKNHLSGKIGIMMRREVTLDCYWNNMREKKKEISCNQKVSGFPIAIERKKEKTIETSS